jgi:hypothetical protein
MRHHLAQLDTPPSAGGTPYLGVGGAGYRLDLMRDAWNQLRNDTLGRATGPDARVPPDLAQRVGERYDAWRNWYGDATRSLFNSTVFFHYGSEFSRQLAAWTEEYGHLQAEVAATLVPLGMTVTAPQLVPVPKSRLPLAAADWSTIAMFAGTGLFLLGLVWVLRKTR